MKETLTDLKNRRSVKAYRSEQISDEELMEVIEAGMNAPSGGNRQSAVFIVVQDREWIDKLCALNAKIAGAPEGFDPFYGAPVILIVLADKEIPTHVYDGALVMGNLLNAAASLGVAGIWIHRAKEEFESDFGKDLLKRLGIEGEYEGIGHCALGYAEGPANEPAPRKDNYVYYI